MADKLKWVKASYSGAAGHCVELARSGTDEFLVRDSKKPDGTVLMFSKAEKDAFIAGAKDGEFDNL